MHSKERIAYSHKARDIEQMHYCYFEQPDNATLLDNCIMLVADKEIVTVSASKKTGLVCCSRSAAVAQSVDMERIRFLLCRQTA